MKNIISKLWGYKKLSDIEIPRKFKMNPPKKDKMYERERYYKLTGKFLVPIVLKENLLVDGYTTYLLAKKLNKKYVKVKRWQE